MVSNRLLLVVAIAAMAQLASSETPDDNLYGQLGLNMSATDDDIRKAFRNLSRIAHPDRSTGNHDDFVKIQLAYDILNDVDLRIVYDQLGLQAVQEAQKRGVENVIKRTDNQHYHVEVSLEDIYSGAEVPINHRRHSFCPVCRGSGAKPHTPFIQCPRCQGAGFTLRIQQMGHFHMQMQEPCGHCQGNGRVPKQQCNRCNGNKIIEESVTFNVQVPRGAPDGHEIIFPRAASCIPKTIPGDVLVSIHSKPHKHFKRDDASTLSRSVKIPLRQALLGFKSSILHLDSHRVHLDRKGQITPFGFTQVIEGEGMPLFENSDAKGSLLIHYKVKFISELSDDHRQELIRVFANHNVGAETARDEL